MLDTRYLIDRNFYLREDYEDELFFMAQSLINLNKINYFFDIGSCWGIYSLRLSSIKKLKIYSFDPIPKNIERLRQMININKLKNISVFNCALGNEKGSINLYGLENFTPNYSLYDKKTSQHIVKSSINKLDNIVKVKNNYLYIKCDIERHEYAFLQGAKKILKNNNIILQIEIFAKNKKKVFNYLNQNKFQCFYENKFDYLFSNFKIKNPRNFRFEGYNFV